MLETVKVEGEIIERIRHLTKEETAIIEDVKWDYMGIYIHTNMKTAIIQS